jgi:hypothetical protein
VVTYRCGIGRERAVEEPSASGVCADVNDRLQVNNTFRMPAKVGPKRVRALARAGCYFDSSAATCGGCVLDLQERVTIVFVRSRCSCSPMRVFNTLRTIVVIAS